jgi:hypothetical protein
VGKNNRLSPRDFSQFSIKSIDKNPEENFLRLTNGCHEQRPSIVQHRFRWPTFVGGCATFGLNILKIKTNVNIDLGLI